MRIKFSLLAISATVAAVPALAVQPVTITSAGIYHPGNVDATVGGATKSEYSVPATLTAITGGRNVDFIGFCIDLPHNLYVAVGSQLQETLGYHVAALTNDGYGTALGTGTVREITGLAALGFSLAKGNAVDKPAQLAAIQQAIWSIEYPTSTFVATGPYAAAQAGYAAAFIKEAPTLKGFARTLVSDDGNVQAQITNVGGVPEPAVWVEMLAGLAAVGVVSRRRATLTTVAA